MLLRTSVTLALLAAAVPALADTHITFVNDQGQVSTQMYVKGNKVRMEFAAGAHQGFALYDTGANEMKVFMPEQKKYMVFNEQSAGEMGAQADASQQQLQGAQQQAQQQMSAHQGQMDEANQKMQAAMANMSPQQRAMMEKMMAGRGVNTNPMAAMPSGGMQVDTKDLGTTESVAGHSCKDVQLSVNGKPSATMCVVDSPASLGIPAADLKTMEAMRDGMQKVVSHMGPMGQGMAAMMGKGFSIKTTRQQFDPKTMKMGSETDTLKSVSTSGLDASLFAMPAGYTETTMQDMMQGGHH